MGEKIDVLRYMGRTLRQSDPPHSFEILVFQFVLFLLCMIFTAIGEFWLWLLCCSAIYITLGIQYLRIRRVMKCQREQAAQRVRNAMDNDSKT